MTVPPRYYSLRNARWPNTSGPFLRVLRLCVDLFRTGILLIGFLFLFLNISLGDTIEADNATIGTLTVNSEGLDFAQSFSGNLDTDVLYINGYQIDQNGSIVGTVQNGDDAWFNSVTMSNDALVGADLSIGPSLSMGSWYDGSTTWTGTVLNFQDNDDETSSNITYIGTSPNVTWSWGVDYGWSNMTQMTVDARGNLTLNPDGYSNLTISPGNLDVDAIPVASFTFETPFSSGGIFSIDSGNIILDGSNVTAPSLTLGWTSMVGSDYGLIIGNAGNLSHFTIDPANLTLGFGGGLSIIYNETGLEFKLDGIGMEIGDNSTVGNNGAVALGNDTHADGVGAVAIAGGNASGNYSLALANGSVASSNGSVAFADGQATANYSLAIGENTTASGVLAIAIGGTVTASTWGGVILGRYNQSIGGNSTAWQSTDPAFVLGTGNSTTSANGIVFKNDGNHTITGNVTITPQDYVSPDSSTQPTGMQVQGGALFNGEVNLNGNITISGPHGDVLMGQFVN